jgi:hypothetical protein
MTVLAADAGAGPIGFAVILALVLATVFLIRSMSKRIGNVKRNAEHWPEDGRDEPPTSPGA